MILFVCHRGISHSERFSSGTGYRDNAVAGMARGDQAEGMHTVVDGTRHNIEWWLLLRLRQRRDQE